MTDPRIERKIFNGESIPDVVAAFQERKTASIEVGCPVPAESVIFFRAGLRSGWEGQVEGFGT